MVLGRSQVHGWGAFALKPVKKGDLVGEYRGELVSQDEADRRGKIYDKLSCSFLFDLDDELRSAPATPPRPPPPPPPAKQTPKKKRFSLRNFFGCRDRPG